MASTTAFLYRDEYLKHETGFGHPERPARLLAIQEALDSSGLRSQLTPVEPRNATLEEIAAVHQERYIERVRAIAQGGGGHLDYDTVISPQSFEIALLAAGAVLSGIDAVLSGKVDNAFACVRPPGHHATPDRGMGFCLFNNVAIGARYAQRAHGIERVLIVDWDVHHGNGTQDTFYTDPSVFYFSIHQHPLYPGTGMESERGAGAGEGTTLNVPVPPGSTDEDYYRAFEEKLLPAARRFRPDLILISAGFDAHESDPLASIYLTAEAFGRLTAYVRELAEECCGGRIVSALEGGYSLHGLSTSVVEHLKGLLA
ncbi:MAG: histone deacetylase [Candidatus Poribacteria bacterium]|nr:MAG: histone deacetylase [Candidatus Poribacteria bacterium]